MNLEKRLSKEIGREEYKRAYEGFNKRFDLYHEHDNLNKESFDELKKICWKNYLKAYYKVKI